MISLDVLLIAVFVVFNAAFMNFIVSGIRLSCRNLATSTDIVAPPS